MRNEKEQYDTNAKATTGNLSQAAMGVLNCAGSQQQAVRASLIERIRERQQRAAQESGRAERLYELSYLLEKNPEVARILDLLDIDVRL